MNNDLISRNALLEELQEDIEWAQEEGQKEMFGLKLAKKRTKHAPAIDAVEVVQCKDCILYGPSPDGHPTIGWCKMHGTHYEPEFFCGLAERKEEKG